MGLQPTRVDKGQTSFDDVVYENGLELTRGWEGGGRGGGGVGTPSRLPRPPSHPLINSNPFSYRRRLGPHQLSWNLKHVQSRWERIRVDEPITRERTWLTLVHSHALSSLLDRDSNSDITKTQLKRSDGPGVDTCYSLTDPNVHESLVALHQWTQFCDAGARSINWRKATAPGSRNPWNDSRVYYEDTRVFFTGKYAVCISYTNLHPGPEWHHILTRRISMTSFPAFIRLKVASECDSI